jgi:hypothetical protein
MKLADVQKYLLTIERNDWNEILRDWSELIPANSTRWLLSSFGELFFIQPDGRIGQLQVSAFQYQVVAQNTQDFEEWLDDPDKLTDWLLAPLVDLLAAAGKQLKPDSCYSFITPLGLGGQLSADNVMVIPIREHFCCFGEIFQHIKDVPDGDQIILKTR